MKTLMIAPGDNVAGVADNTIKLGVVNVKDKGAHACIFTDRASAENVRSEFRRAGKENNIIAVAFSEIAELVCQCDGVVVDVDSYCFVMNAEEVEYICEKCENKDGCM